MAAAGRRLDQWLVAHGHAATRSRARWLIDAGLVRVYGQPCHKPALPVTEASAVEVQADALPYVSRGGVKLERALDVCGMNVAEVVALDVGASTGGFTDCLLRRGARRVYALDVGTGQLAPALRADPRVISLEGRNIRTFSAAELAESVALITVDVAFISLVHVLPLLPPFLEAGGRVLALVKPQFEVGVKHVGRGGIVRDPDRRALAQRRVIAMAEDIGFHVRRTIEAPRLHAHSNQEVFIDLEWLAPCVTLVAGQRPPRALKPPS
jgi:23S rRNA (cytidine1920-2'-O)/16S rRNA (cytidine1409-2'-O)-methyltransferase